MQPQIPVPILFSPIKHHLFFLQNKIKRWRRTQRQVVQEDLLLIGNNLIDFYTGTLSTEQITTELIHYFIQNHIVSKSAFLNWLQAPKWKKIRISDGSLWLVKNGNDDERYIHVHPAKFSEHTIRVRANTLKTVLALEIEGIDPHFSHKINLDNVNHVRRLYFSLSPVKSLHTADSGIMRLWLLFHSNKANV